MKMEMQVVAPFPGKVRQVMAIANVQVSPGTPLLQIDPSTEARTKRNSDPLQFAQYRTVAGPAGGGLWKQYVAEAKQLMLGFEVNPEHIARSLVGENGTASPVTEGTRAAEDEVLSTFVDSAHCSGKIRNSPRTSPSLPAPKPTCSLIFEP